MNKPKISTVRTVLILGLFIFFPSHKNCIIELGRLISFFRFLFNDTKLDYSCNKLMYASKHARTGSHLFS